jgi:hypothetical protein
MFVVRRCNVVSAPAEPNVCPLRARSLAPACSLIDLKHTPPLEAVPQTAVCGCFNPACINEQRRPRVRLRDVF